MVTVLIGSLLITGSVQAQEPPAQQQPAAADPGYASGPAIAPAASGGGIKDNGPHQRPSMASALLYTPWRFGLGVGLKLGYEIPLVHDGFIPSINNSFSIEPNLGFAWNSYNWGYGYYGGSLYNDDVSAIEVTPGVSVLWSFYFSQRFRAYAAVHVGLTILKPYWTGDDDVDGDFETYFRFHGELAPGIVYNLNDRIALRAELGWWSGAKFGIGILL
jgi:hypothetical protein